MIQTCYKLLATNMLQITCYKHVTNYLQQTCYKLLVTNNFLYVIRMEMSSQFWRPQFSC